jgi:NADPH:quinone reductase-like Zn-dependent oxidoreductase
MKTLKRIFKWGFLILLVAGLAWFGIAYATSTNDCEQLGKTQGDTMKAIVYCEYGTAEVLKVMDIAKPVPKDNQVLVRVRAAAVNPYDWHFIRGTPYIMRLGVGLRKPKDTRLGVDFSGTVEAVGKDVTEFKPGDEVWGGKGGAFAQYVVIAEKALVKKPENVSFEQAGSIQIAGMTALQALRKHGNIQPGQKVLINGASGGVGTFAVQIAKALGAHVTGVCSGRNIELVKSLGADEVIDYTKEDFAKRPERYDLFLDNVPNHPLSECRQVLTPTGKYVMIGGGGPNDGDWIGPFGRVIQMMIQKRFQKAPVMMMMAENNKADMNYLNELMQSGKMKPVIDKTYKLSEVPDAITYLEKGHARGKVAITVD